MNVQGVQLIAIENSSALQSLQWVENNGHTYRSTGTGLVLRSDHGHLCGWRLLRRRHAFCDWPADRRLDLRLAQPRSVCRSRPAPDSERQLHAAAHGVSYYKTNYEILQYVPLWGRWNMDFLGQVGYGAGLGKTTSLPPYELFYGGGPDSVRGFQESRLGPRDQYGNPYGGNLNVLGRAELIVPLPSKVASSARLTLFLDVGNVFSTGKSRSSMRHLLATAPVRSRTRTSTILRYLTKRTTAFPSAT